MVYLKSLRKIYICLGYLFVSFAIIGIFIPVLPTTPLLLLAAALFARSSPRLHYWILKHPLLGSYLRDYYRHKAIPLRIKIVSVTLILLSFSISIIFIVESIFFKVVLGLIGTWVIYYILKLKTLSIKDSDG